MQNSLSVDIEFLHTMTLDVIEASRVRPGESVGDLPPNTTGGTLIRPGGRDCYPSFWIRDFTMAMSSGLIPADEIEHAVEVTALGQAESTVTLSTGGIVPEGAIADHILFDGRPIYFPGTYDPDNQGGTYGVRPSLDDNFFFAEMLHAASIAAGKPELLLREVEGARLLDRAAQAFDVPEAGEEDGLVWCDDSNRGVSFGFTDSIYHTGRLLFASLLRLRAAEYLERMYRRVAEIERERGNAGDGFSTASDRFAAEAIKIRSHLVQVFAHKSGLLAASDGVSAQPDVWGSAFAAYLGAVDPDVSRRICETLAAGCRDETIAWRGNVRHVPTTWDFGKDSAWERTVGGRQKNRYQNGAYWGTATGWVCFAVAQADGGAAERLATEYIDELKEGDFRKGSEYGSPWECMHPDGYHFQNPVYLASVACPYAAFRRIGWGS